MSTSIGNKCEYIGETKRKLNQRIAEHLTEYTDINRRSQVFQHAKNVHGECSSSNWKVEVLGRETREVERKIKEAKFIGQINPKLNMNQGITYIR